MRESSSSTPTSRTLAGRAEEVLDIIQAVLEGPAGEELGYSPGHAVEAFDGVALFLGVGGKHLIEDFLEDHRHVLVLYHPLLMKLRQAGKNHPDFGLIFIVGSALWAAQPFDVVLIKDEHHPAPERTPAVVLVVPLAQGQISQAFALAVGQLTVCRAR